jgi:hypothetical protein
VRPGRWPCTLGAIHAAFVTISAPVHLTQGADAVGSLASTAYAESVSKQATPRRTPSCDGWLLHTKISLLRSGSRWWDGHETSPPPPPHTVLFSPLPKL